MNGWQSMAIAAAMYDTYDKAKRNSRVERGELFGGNKKYPLLKLELIYDVIYN